jgi:hypothetical protein
MSNLKNVFLALLEVGQAKGLQYALLVILVLTHPNPLVVVLLVLQVLFLRLVKAYVGYVMQVLIQTQVLTAVLLVNLALIHFWGQQFVFYAHLDIFLILELLIVVIVLLGPTLLHLAQKLVFLAIAGLMHLLQDKPNAIYALLEHQILQ